MRALAVRQRPAQGEFSERLQMLDLPVPEPRKGEVRVRVAAAAINVDDQHLAEGSMFGGFPVSPRPSPDKPYVPGVDLAGMVHAVGPGVARPEVGERVYGLRAPRQAGAWAEYAIVNARSLSAVPDGWNWEEAGALCLAGMVVCSIVGSLPEPIEGLRCVVVGASGSIGSLLVPVLSRAGARVWGVCSGHNRERVLSLGAHEVIDYRESPFDEPFATRGERVDAVIDLVGGREVERRARAIARPGGAFVTIVGPERHVGERKLRFSELTSMLGRIGWSWLRSRFSGPTYHFAGPLSPDFGAINRWIVDPGIRPAIDQVVRFELKAVRDAVRHVASHHAQGKVVIALTPTRMESEI